MTELTEVTVHSEAMEVATRSSKRLCGLRGRTLCPRPFLGGKVAVGPVAHFLVFLQAPTV